MLEGFNLLFVEDEESITDIIEGVLVHIFNKVYIKNNGQDGLDFFKKNKNDISLIITDISMPVMDGITMAEQIKEINPAIPIIISSAYQETRFLKKAINIGIDAFVLKPVGIDELINTSRKLLEPIALKKELIQQQKETQDQLVRNAKFAAIGQLAAGLTHEINTPLTYIKGSVEIMDKILTRLEDSKNKDLLQKQFIRVDDGVNRLINLVESMKDAAVKTSEEFSQVNIYETIIVACTMAYNRAKHNVKVKVNEEEFKINIDKHKYIFAANVQKQRVEQVWIIIINNALDELAKIDSFENRKLEIFIEECENEINIKFCDNAGGISEEIKDKLFEPFKSVKDCSGIGIGLSIAKNIIEAQNGDIIAYNKNNGAVFEVVLPK